MNCLLLITLLLIAAVSAREQPLTPWQRVVSVFSAKHDIPARKNPVSDAAKLAGNNADEVAKVAVNNADDVAKVAVNNADEAAKVTKGIGRTGKIGLAFGVLGGAAALGGLALKKSFDEKQRRDSFRAALQPRFRH